MNHALVCLALLIGVTACRDTTGGIRTEFVGSYAFSATERRTIARIAGAKVPWGEYPDDVSMWVEELFKQPANAKLSDWIFRHPDGRRWIGMRAGTYLADRAMKQLNRTSAELVAMPTADILAAANTGR